MTRRTIVTVVPLNWTLGTYFYENARHYDFLPFPHGGVTNGFSMLAFRSPEEAQRWVSENTSPIDYVTVKPVPLH